MDSCTIEDIINELRYGHTECGEEWTEDCADRLEAAMKERDAMHERHYKSLANHCKKLEDEYVRVINALKKVDEIVQLAFQSK